MMFESPAPSDLSILPASLPVERLTVPDVLPMVKAYYAKPGNDEGGSLHIVLEDGNVSDHSVHYCLKQAEAQGDLDGVVLANTLLQMTKTQRLKIASFNNLVKNEL